MLCVWFQVSVARSAVDEVVSIVSFGEFMLSSFTYTLLHCRLLYLLKFTCMGSEGNKLIIDVYGS